ncbi:NAD(P)-binding protein [Conidiobolus coronatus NRRL 28638]|uniref:NAD(P)-binding protein n=1 Tax=Conidiobolus coronatus (strain ATCC 28846 / CBS 209.66 / NRRL 28638) TaxID=796925 RepID=A0A137NT45_CONC2|nr:NAD(P)-binding protein [Conidiobolus coronatus NRRL 28638]|eukprot:KXN65900.1 NAD(P)-binding protein [Conidiobolus coronatus NRRL 28638]
MNINGLTAIITGGASGIGESTCKLLVNKGAKVIIADINDELGSKLEIELNKNSKCAKYIHCDVRKSNDIQKCFNYADKEFGGAQILINNAGIYEQEDDIECLDKTKRIIDINFVAVVQGTQLALKSFQDQLKLDPMREFCIINVSSMCATLHAAFLPIYSVTKTAVKILTQILGQCEYKQIRINGIMPSITQTPILKQFPLELLEIGEGIGFLTSDHIASRILKLIEDSSINGEVMRVEPTEDDFEPMPPITPLLKPKI